VKKSYLERYIQFTNIKYILIVVAICWGSTNPLIKAGSSGLDKVSENYPEGGSKKWLAELKYLFTRWQVTRVVCIKSLVYNADNSIVRPSISS
jgi:hypothetical protein